MRSPVFLKTERLPVILRGRREGENGGYPPSGGSERRWDGSRVYIEKRAMCRDHSNMAEAKRMLNAL